MPSRRRLLLTLAALLLLALLSIGAALASGSLDVPIREILAALLGGQSPGAEVVRQLRLPRALAAFACGGLLAFAGALMQVLLRNPLADPYILGVSGGASIGALSAMLLGLSGLGVDSLAFLGALATLLLVFGLAHGDGSWTQSRLLLTGVIVASGCGAVVALLLTLAAEQQLRGMVFWLMGDLASSGAWGFSLAVLALSVLLALPFARELNLLARGADSARALGVAVPRLYRLVYFLAAVATAVAVSQAGTIGFVGLIVPHLVRLATGNDQRLLLPAAALAGGSLLVLADTLARTIVAPLQLPVGILTAMLGVPLFLLLLSRRPR